MDCLSFYTLEFPLIRGAIRNALMIYLQNLHDFPFIIQIRIAQLGASAYTFIAFEIMLFTLCFCFYSIDLPISSKTDQLQNAKALIHPTST